MIFQKTVVVTVVSAVDKRINENEQGTAIILTSQKEVVVSSCFASGDAS